MTPAEALKSAVEEIQRLKYRVAVLTEDFNRMKELVEAHERGLKIIEKSQGETK